jgi:beta-phosphoglucomutase-like phosphatase (HAD superfamily)
MCIATATERYQVETALARCGMKQFFSGIFTCTEVGSGKDEPVIFRTALEHLGTERCNTIVFEDAYHAVLTAKNDGFLVAAIYDAHEDKQGDIQQLSDVYLTDFSDMTAFWEFATNLRREQPT